MSGPISRVVVLMMENHSFDHLLGWLPGIGRLNEQCSNPLDPGDPASERVPVSRGAEFRTDPCPDHGLADVNIQIFGTEVPEKEQLPSMEGFVSNYVSPRPEKNRKPGDAKTLMGCYSPEQLPVIATLAKEFVVCTHWFASVPGPTGPNRLFVNCATSGGYAGDAWYQGQAELPAKLATETLFERLSKHDRSWGLYYEDFATELCLDVLRSPRFEGCRHASLCDFFWDLEKDQLPDYCFLTPRLIETAPLARPGCRFPMNKGECCLCQTGNSMHSPDDVRHGEELIARVYEAIRAKPSVWENTLLIVTWDEHGGFYDSASPPMEVASPDGLGYEQAPGFDFTRLGVRVPALLISTWTDAAIDETVYEHASIPATVIKLFGLGEPLTARDAAAATFEHHFNRSQPRDDNAKIARPAWPPKD